MRSDRSPSASRNPAGTSAYRSKNCATCSSLEPRWLARARPSRSSVQQVSSIHCYEGGPLGSGRSRQRDGRKRSWPCQLHVKHLQVQGGRVVAVDTNQGQVPVPPNGKVIFALEPLRATTGPEHLAGSRCATHRPQPDGSHRSNLTSGFRAPPLQADWGTPEPAGGALFAKCRHQFADNSLSTFTSRSPAAGLGELGTDSEAELFKLIPDIAPAPTSPPRPTPHRHHHPQRRRDAATESRQLRSWTMLDEFVSSALSCSSRPQQRTRAVAEHGHRTDEAALMFAAGDAYELQTSDGSWP